MKSPALFVLTGLLLAQMCSADYTVKQEKGRLTIASDGRPVLTYQMEPGEVPEGMDPVFRHGAHLHPVYSPSGRLVTGNHPLDHPWQRGVWMGWTKTEFDGGHPDFWNMGKGPGGETAGERLPAEIRFVKLEKVWSDRAKAGFLSTHRWLDRTTGAEKSVLDETWEVNVFSGERMGRRIYLVDLISTQRCAGDKPLKLPKYHYGGLGVRGHEQWNPPDKVTMLTSNGDDRAKGDATKAKWVWLGGEVDGEVSGVAVLIHPSNFRFPQPLRLNPKNPQLSVAPSQDGDWDIVPGKPFVSRYRLAVFDGAPDSAFIESLWKDYAG